jgi:fatty acid desaturase
LFKRDLARCLFAIARIWLGIFLAWWAVGTFGAWMVLPAIVWIGTLQYHLNVMGHDGLHFLIADSRSTNDTVCRWLLHGPHGAPLGAMRRNHLNHHTQFGGTADLDRQYYDTSRFSGQTAFRLWLVCALLGGMTIPIVIKLLRRKRPAGEATPVARAAAPGTDRTHDLLSVVASQAWIGVACWLFTGWWYAYLLLWLAPMLTVMVGLNSIRSCLEHAQSGSSAPGLHSFVSGPVERFFLAPLNMNVHAEHHLVPAVPWHQLPALRAHLQAEGSYDKVTLFESYAQRAGQLVPRPALAPSDRLTR